MTASVFIARQNERVLLLQREMDGNRMKEFERQ
jgi:hypothetical protein